MNPRFVPYADMGDFVIVVNADQIKLTGRKLEQKTYYHHTGYIGSLKSITAKKLMEKRPEDLIRHAVRGMLPKNSLGRKINKKLKVYVGPEHPHQAQQPITINAVEVQSSWPKRNITPQEKGNAPLPGPGYGPGPVRL